LNLRQKHHPIGGFVTSGTEACLACPLCDRGISSPELHNLVLRLSNNDNDDDDENNPKHNRKGLDSLRVAGHEILNVAQTPNPQRPCIMGRGVMDRPPLNRETRVFSSTICESFVLSDVLVKRENARSRSSSFLSGISPWLSPPNRSYLSHLSGRFATTLLTLLDAPLRKPL
jgi:hypothetical protein